MNCAKIGVIRTGTLLLLENGVECGLRCNELSRISLSQ